MRRLVLILAVLAGLAACSRGERVIPADKMAAMYEEMFVLDQWIRATPALGRVADTSLVYLPILERYGYTAEDYRASVEYYLSEPAEFSGIFQTVKDRLQKRVDELTAAEEGVSQREAYRRAIEARTDFVRPRIFDFGDTLDLTREVSVVWDSLGVSVVERVLPDTLYEGPVFHLRDTVAVADTVAVVDTVAAEKTVAAPNIEKMTENEKILREIPVLAE
ncbi:MAG: DUF4296 domain-containing protein [Bacteroidales bacterium]|nr:DUF4296 domain-containing protein [Bacteroidales bacterium]